MIGWLVAALATWRISAWLWYETDGQQARAWLCQWPALAQRIDCFWCVTLWVALAVSPVVLLGAWWLLAPFALSGTAILLSGGGRTLWREMSNQDDGR